MTILSACWWETLASESAPMDSGIPQNPSPAPPRNGEGKPGLPKDRLTRSRQVRYMLRSEEFRLSGGAWNAPEHGLEQFATFPAAFKENCCSTGAFSSAGKVLVNLGLFLLFLACSAFMLAVLIKHEPTFYREAYKPAGPERTLQSVEFESRCGSLINGIQNRYPDWWEVFTTDQINAFLQEGFLTSWGGNNNLPDGIRDLRVEIEDGRLRIGCRYGRGFWSTTITIDLKIWLVAKEVNLIGVEGWKAYARAAYTISRQIVLDYISEAAHRKNIEVKWYHRKSNPVAIMKLQADQVRPTISNPASRPAIGENDHRRPLDHDVHVSPIHQPLSAPVNCSLAHSILQNPSHQKRYCDRRPKEDEATKNTSERTAELLPHHCQHGLLSVRSLSSETCGPLGPNVEPCPRSRYRPSRVVGFPTRPRCRDHR